MKKKPPHCQNSSPSNNHKKS